MQLPGGGRRGEGGGGGGLKRCQKGFELVGEGIEVRKPETLNSDLKRHAAAVSHITHEVQAGL